MKPIIKMSSSLRFSFLRLPSIHHWLWFSQAHTGTNTPCRKQILLTSCSDNNISWSCEQCQLIWGCVAMTDGCGCIHCRCLTCNINNQTNKSLNQHFRNIIPRPVVNYEISFSQTTGNSHWLFKVFLCSSKWMSE